MLRKRASDRFHRAPRSSAYAAARPTYHQIKAIGDVVYDVDYVVYGTSYMVHASFQKWTAQNPSPKKWTPPLRETCARMNA